MSSYPLNRKIPQKRFFPEFWAENAPNAHVLIVLVSPRFGGQEDCCVLASHVASRELAGRRRFAGGPEADAAGLLEAGLDKL